MIFEKLNEKVDALAARIGEDRDKKSGVTEGRSMPFSLLGLRRTFRNANRVRQIVNVFLKYGFGKIIDQIHLNRFIPFRKSIRTFGQWPPLKSPTVPEKTQDGLCRARPQFHQTRPDTFDEARPHHQALCRRIQEASGQGPPLSR